jgi:hypothetical protein
MGVKMKQQLVRLYRWLWSFKPTAIVLGFFTLVVVCFLGIITLIILGVDYLFASEERRELMRGIDDWND